MIQAGDADSIDLARDRRLEIRDPAGGLRPGITEYSGPSFTIDVLGFNRNIQPTNGVGWREALDFFADAHVRRTFEYAFDYQNFSRGVMYGEVQPLRGPFPQGMFGADPRLPLPTYDLDLAAAELRQTPSWNRNLTIDLFYSGPNLVQKQTLLSLKPGLEAIHTLKGSPGNISVRAWPLSWIDYLSAERGHGLPIYTFSLTPDYADPDDLASLLLRSGGLFSSAMSYSNTSLDTLIDRQRVEQDPSVRLDLLSKVQQGALNDDEYIRAGQETLNPVFRSWITGVFTNPTLSGNYYYSLGKT